MHGVNKFLLHFKTDRSHKSPGQKFSGPLFMRVIFLFTIPALNLSRKCKNIKAKNTYTFTTSVRAGKLKLDLTGLIWISVKNSMPFVCVIDLQS